MFFRLKTTRYDEPGDGGNSTHVSTVATPPAYPVNDSPNSAGGGMTSPQPRRVYPILFLGGSAGVDPQRRQRFASCGVLTAGNHAGADIKDDWHADGFWGKILAAGPSAIVVDYGSESWMTPTVINRLHDVIRRLNAILLVSPWTTEELLKYVPRDIIHRWTASRFHDDMVLFSFGSRIPVQSDMFPSEVIRALNCIFTDEDDNIRRKKTKDCHAALAGLGENWLTFEDAVAAQLKQFSPCARMKLSCDWSWNARQGRPVNAAILGRLLCQDLELELQKGRPAPATSKASVQSTLEDYGMASVDLASLQVEYVDNNFGLPSLREAQEWVCANPGTRYATVHIDAKTGTTDRQTKVDFTDPTARLKYAQDIIVNDWSTLKFVGDFDGFAEFVSSNLRCGGIVVLRYEHGNMISTLQEPFHNRDLVFVGMDGRRRGIWQKCRKLVLT